MKATTICICCKRIRDNKGNWHKLEKRLNSIIADICPKCAKKHPFLRIVNQEERNG